MPKFTKKILENGLTILHEERDIPVTTVMFAVKYGSAYEKENEKGIAHFLEHLCFKATKTRTAEQISSEIEKKGGVLNAFTHEELICFHVKISSDYLQEAMDILSDIFFNPTFPENEIEKERQVILEELKMYTDNPASYASLKIKSCLYENPFGMFIGGTEKAVKSLKRQDILNVHKKFFVPKNTIISIVGKNPFSQIFEETRKIKMPESDFKKEKYSPNISIKNIVESRKGIEQVNLAIATDFPNSSSEQKYSAEIFRVILGEGMASKLFLEVREKRGLVYNIKSFLDSGKEYGGIFILAGTSKDKTEEVLDICKKEFKKMKNISEKELKEAKKQVIGMHNLEKESSEETALNLVLSELFGDAKEYYDFENKINSVSLDDIKNLSQKENFSTFILQPAN